MTRVLLIRHGQSAANVSGILAGQVPGVHLSEAGEQQARALGEDLSGLPLAGIHASPLDRTLETAQLIAAAQPKKARVVRDRKFIEVDYGKWSGAKLSKLVKEPMWQQIQTTPSSVTFPEGEAMFDAQNRVNEGIARIVAKYPRRGRQDPVVVVATHADVVKLVLAHALGMHMDHFQRINVDPGSASLISYGSGPPLVTLVNESGADVARLAGHSAERVVPGGATHNARSRK